MSGTEKILFGTIVILSGIIIGDTIYDYVREEKQRSIDRETNLAYKIAEFIFKMENKRGA